MTEPDSANASPPLHDLAAFVINRLYRPMTRRVGETLHGVLETQYPTEGDVWFWSDDNAKVLELLSIPDLWRRWKTEVGEILRFLCTMCDSPFIFRRYAEPRLRTLHQEGGNGAWEHALMNIGCDLAHGVVSLGVRFHDGRTARYVTMTGNYVELTYAGMHHVLDAEDSIDETAISLDDDVLVLRHSAPLQIRRRWRTAAIGRIAYTYRIAPCTMLVEVTAELTLADGIEVADVILTFGQDGLSHGETNVHYGRIVTRCGAEDGPHLSAGEPGTQRLNAAGCGYFALVQDEIAGFALAIHALPEDPARVEGLVATVQEAGRLHWVVSRHRFDGLHRGGVLRAREDKAITAGGLYSRTADYERLWRAERASRDTALVALDLSISYDYGVEINAFAKCYASLAAEPELADGGIDAASLRLLFDRTLATYRESFIAGHSAGGNDVFSRQLAFVILGVATMLRATGEAAYRTALAELVDVLLAFEFVHPGITGDSESGFFMGIATNRTVYVDCHSAALLALARASADLDDPRLAEVIDRGLAVYTVETAAISFNNTLHKADVLAVSWQELDGQRHSNNGFWNYQAGLTLRAFAAMRASPDARLLPVLERHAERMRLFEAMLHRQIARSTFRHDDGTDIRSSVLSGETNSETQPWVALALHGHPWD